VEGMVFETSGPRMFVNVRGNRRWEGVDAQPCSSRATWPSRSAKSPQAIASDEASPPGCLSVPGPPAKTDCPRCEFRKVVNSYPAAAMVDDMAYDGQRKRIYLPERSSRCVPAGRCRPLRARVAHISHCFSGKDGDPDSRAEQSITWRFRITKSRLRSFAFTTSSPSCAHRASTLHEDAHYPRHSSVPLCDHHERKGQTGPTETAPLKTRGRRPF